MLSVELSAGTIEYADSEGDGPVVVLIGGLAIGPSLWDGVVAELRGSARCIVPTLPWGAHRIPMRPDADLTMRGQARIVGEFLAALDLDDVTLVENDTAMAQVLCAGGCDRVGRLVITSCEAFDNYPPGIPGKAVALAAKVPGGIFLTTQQLRAYADYIRQTGKIRIFEEMSPAEIAALPPEIAAVAASVISDLNISMENRRVVALLDQRGELAAAPAEGDHSRRLGTNGVE